MLYVDMNLRGEVLFASFKDRRAYSEGFQLRINTKRFVNERYKTSLGYFKVFMLFSILLASTLAYPASYGQSEVVLSLDKRVYTVGESVVIFGFVPSPSNIPAIIQVWNPNNEACSFQQVSVNDDGSFTASPILLSGRTCGIAGTYTIKAFYGEFDGSATFEVQLPTTTQKAGNGRLQTLLDILNKSRQNVDNKIADVQGKGIVIPDDINAVYNNGLAEFESTKQAVNAGDTDSAKEHAKNAMKAFREVFAALITLEQGEVEAPTAASQEEEKDLEKAEEVSRLRQAIARAIEFKNKLMNIAATSAATSAIQVHIADFDKAITEAAEFAEKGDIDAAASSLARVNLILSDIHKSLMENAQKHRLDRVKEFVAKTVERIDRMIADAKALGIPQEVIDALEAAKQKMLNAKTINEITGISKELKDKQEELSGHKGKNFEKALENLRSKLEETKTKAGQMGLDLNVFERIQGLIDDAIAKWESGETKNAVDTLEKSEEILREVNGILDHISNKLQELNRLENLAEELKGKYQDNPEALNAIEKALRLITGAKETLQSAISKKDLRIAEDMTQQAKRILERVKNLEIEKKLKTDVGDASNIEKFAAELERKASRLQQVAEEQGNHEALAVIRQALDLIMKAKQMVSEENYDRAKALLREANDLLNKAERMLKKGSDLNAPSVKEAQAHALMTEIQVLEAVAVELKSGVGDNEDALEEIEEALNDLADAKEYVRSGELGEAKQKVSDAKEHLRKAKEIIEHDKGGAEEGEKKERERKNERKNEREGKNERERGNGKIKHRSG